MKIIEHSVKSFIGLFYPLSPPNLCEQVGTQFPFIEIEKAVVDAHLLAIKKVKDAFENSLIKIQTLILGRNKCHMYRCFLLLYETPSNNHCHCWKHQLGCSVSVSAARLKGGPATKGSKEAGHRVITMQRPISNHCRCRAFAFGCCFTLF